MENKIKKRLKTVLHQVTTNAICVFLIMASGHSYATDVQRNQAKRIHDRLTGVLPSNAVIDQMETALGSDATGESAAQIAIQNPAFYNVTLKNFAAPWTNEAQSVFVPLNDYTATVIGMVRDDVDFREVLSGDILYTGTGSLGLTASYSNTNNAHYEEMDDQAIDLSDQANLADVGQTSVRPGVAPAGVMTSRAAAEAFFEAGTNRAMFRFTMMNYLCTDLEPLKDASRVPDYVRQDVTRSPGGDSRIFLNNCVGCHAGMDGLAGAYAYYDFDETTGQMIYTPGTVTAKHLINSTNFKDGYVTTDDSWINYWRNGQNALLGWNTYAGEVLDSKGHSTGNGAASFGRELANSDAFASCQVKKAFKALCFRDADDYAADRSQVNTITTYFKNNGYRMKDVFVKVAAYCKGN